MHFPEVEIASFPARRRPPGGWACLPLSPSCNPLPFSENSLMARVIEVVVSPTGETTVQTKGYAGGDCLLASKFMEQALGIALS